jgi:hypothetical protein
MEQNKIKGKAAEVRLTLKEIKQLPEEMQREINGAVRLQEIMRGKRGKKTA